jgi:hypothetical protein
MKAILALLLSSLLVYTAIGQDTTMKAAVLDPAKKILLVDASCGMCKFGMSGDDCKLAVRIDGKAYYVDGTGIDQHGDAHAKDGFCNAIRKAQVQGSIVDNRFKASYFKLVKQSVKDKRKRINDRKK